MSHSAASLIAADVDLRRTVERITRTPGVIKVVCGSFSNASHSHRAGNIKVVREHHDHLDLRVYIKRGMVNVYAYATRPADVRDALVAGRQLPSSSPTVATMESIPLKSSAPATPAPARPATAPRLAAPVSVTPLPAAPAPVPVTPTSEVRTAALVADTTISGALVTITPEVAFSWLTRNTRNRALRAGVVERYARDMRAGRWKPGGSIIKFDVDGTIVNGQHTLNAVVESMATIQAYVITGVDPSVAVVEDEHSPRRIGDAIRIQTPGRHASSLVTATATMLRRSIQMNLNNGSSQIADITRQEEIAFVESYRDAIDFAVGCFTLSGPGTRKGIVVAPLLAAVARASFTENHERLRKFAHVVQSGMVSDVNENAAVALRNGVLLATVGSGVPLKAEMFRKCERALRAFLDGEQLRVIKPASAELFPLPEEKHLARKGRKAAAHTTE